jgi:DNA-binding transcriptional ArsR family regulator
MSTPELPHPATQDIDLSAVYDALRDATRRRILLLLDEHTELNCSSFLGLGSKSRLSYHLARLRESGLTQTRAEGTARYMRLRRDDLARRFPGLLDAMITAARQERQDAPAPPPAPAPATAGRRGVKKAPAPGNN